MFSHIMNPFSKGGGTTRIEPRPIETYGPSLFIVKAGDNIPEALGTAEPLSYHQESISPLSMLLLKHMAYSKEITYKNEQNLEAN